MKLSFSFAKTAAPKKSILPTHRATDESPQRREILVISAEGGIVTEKTPEDIELESKVPLVIPCKRNFSKPEREIEQTKTLHEKNLKSLEDTAGILTGEVVHHREHAHECTHTEPEQKPVKKQKTSILMQIHEARARGEIRDAPDQETRSYDPDDFGWAVLRGMGYDESNDEGLKHDVTKDVVGNRAKLGLGVKRESVVLPTDKVDKKK
jgi:hypothetical protein